MAYFPMFIDLKDKKCSVAGGGKVALRKVESLLKFEGAVEVIAPRICDEILAYGDRVKIRKKEAVPEDFKESFLVIAATDNRNVNHSISSFCREHHIFVNVIDSREECSFVFPATVKREDISVGVTTSGASPVLSSTIRKAVEKAVPEFYGPLSRELGRWREELKERIREEAVRKKIFRSLTELGIEQEGKLPTEQVESLIRDEMEKYRKIQEEV